MDVISILYQLPMIHVQESMSKESSQHILTQAIFRNGNQQNARDRFFSIECFTQLQWRATVT